VSRFDFRPKDGGAEYDPADVGGQVISLSLWPGPGLQGPPAIVVTNPGRPRPGVYRFDIPDDEHLGRYWGSVRFVAAQGQAATVDRSVRLDLPNGAGLVTSPEAVAGMLRVPLPLSPEQREDFIEEILRAQTDVAGYLGRPLMPRVVRLASRMPIFGGDPGRWESWRGSVDDDEDFEVDAWTEHPDGSFDVTLRVGLDGAAELPIQRYVAAHASEALRASGVYGQRRVSSVSAEGQSVSYEATPTAAAAGALPTLESLDSYRTVPVFIRRKPAASPWPYGPSHRGGW